MKQYQDHYFKKAKRERFPARSVYKLEEIDRRFRLLKPGQKVLDLGAAPGSWTLYAADRVGERGRVLGLDLAAAAVALPRNAAIEQADLLGDQAGLAGLLDQLSPFDVVLSDMAPRTSGVRFADQARSLELCERARDVAFERLAPGGGFVAKIFEGPDAKAFVEGLRPRFASVKVFKPKSSRSESKEIFVVGLGFRGREG